MFLCAESEKLSRLGRTVPSFEQIGLQTGVDYLADRSTKETNELKIPDREIILCIEDAYIHKLQKNKEKKPQRETSGHQAMIFHKFLLHAKARCNTATW